MLFNKSIKVLQGPDSLCCGPRKFIKQRKPPIVTLRLNRHVLAIYIDDQINVGLTLDE